MKQIWLLKYSFVLIVLLISLHGLYIVYLSYQTFPSDKLNRSIDLKGKIISIPENKTHHTDFLFETKKGLVKLSWYKQYTDETMPDFKPGQKWRFHVKLEKPRGFLNFGLFNYGDYLLRNGIVATGYIQTSNDFKLLDNGINGEYFNYIRLVIKNWIQVSSNGFDQYPVKAFLNALLIGDQSGLTNQYEELLQKTGTSHLFVISGLHVGLIFGWSFLIAKFGLALLALFAARNGVFFKCVHESAIITAMIMALIYSLLAGFSLPTQRALLMITCFSFAFLFNMNLSFKRIWFISFLLVTLWNPYALISAGFWFSFTAVGFLLLTVSIIKKNQSWYQKWIYPQLVVLCALLPLNLYWFGYFSPGSFLANMIAIPLVSILIVPSLFGAFLLLLMGINLLYLPAYLIMLLLNYLQWVHEITAELIFYSGASLLTLIMAVFGMVLIFFPKGFPGRFIAPALIVPLFAYHYELPNKVLLRMTVFDVGQGLSILFQLPNKIILYDTGPEFASGQNAIDYVVSPYLKDHGIYHIDRLIVSHSDSDHAGGVQTLKNQFNIGKIDTTFVKGKPAINVKANQCQNGRQWHEGSIHFAYLNPSDSYQYARGDNNTSCVLKIHMNHTSILLTGDIKYKLERHLVKHYGSKLDSEVLIAPHHGSKSSSHLQFVNSVDPDYVIYSAGYNNRYDHPHQEVIKRYKKHNTFQLSTSKQGAISIDFYKNGKINLKSYLNKENNVY